jgi:hypothetical protein
VLDLPWLDGDGYEDWYLVEDWAALGVLREAAVAAGHHSAHDAAARHFGRGTAGLYRLSEGGAVLTGVTLAVWVTPDRESREAGVASLLLGDGLDGDAGLWRRELVLGPAPEYCVLGDAAPAGVRNGRLPDGWRTLHSPREAIA